MKTNPQIAERAETWRRRIAGADLVQVQGRVTALVGMSIRAVLPGLNIGQMVEIKRRSQGDAREPLLAQVIGFVGHEATLVPLGSLAGVGPDDPVVPADHAFEILCGPSLLGRVVDGLGAPIDDLGPLRGEPWSVMRDPPSPMNRPRVSAPLSVGVRAIDALLTVGEGQRVGIFAGSGVGKTSLLGQIARQADADVFVVCLIGERGRELAEFLEDALGEQGRSRGVVVCATSDTPASVRLRSAYTATAIAEWFRDQGKRVVLLMDSLTRFARAGREVGLAALEPPTRRGYPPSVFARLPRLLERSGRSSAGSITAFYTVLVEGDDMDEPVADEVRGMLDGHVVLSREISARGRFPAIDPLQSVSRVMPSIVEKPHLSAAHALREHIATYEEKRDLVLLGAYRAGTDTKLDAALSRIDDIEAFLRQDLEAHADFSGTVEQLKRLG